jgi:hypothetical protein
MRRREGVTAMFWLIWIVLMILTPMLAGVRVWLQLRQQGGEAPGDASREAQ